MNEDKLNETLIVDDFTPILHALERIKEQGEETERGKN